MLFAGSNATQMQWDLHFARYSAFSALTLLVGRQEGHSACKNEWWVTGMVICLKRDADLHMAQLMPLPLTVSCFSKIQIGFTFLVPAHPGSPGKMVVKRVCVCVRGIVVIFSSVVNKILTIFVRFCVQDQSNHFIFDWVIQEDKAGRASGDDYVLTNVVDIRTLGQETRWAYSTPPTSPHGALT